MTTNQKLLALDAACCSAECLGGTWPDLAAAISIVQDEVEKLVSARYEGQPFSAYLADLKAAVGALKDNPALFGCEPPATTSKGGSYAV